PVSAESRGWQLLPVSARTATALDMAASRLAAHLAGHPELPLADVAYTLQVGRTILPHRGFVLARDTHDAARSLATSAEWTSGVADSRVRPCVFMFTGQGAQYAGMARGLYESEPSFHADVDGCASALQPHLGLDLRAVLFGDDASNADRLRQTALAQPALFTI